MGKTRGKDASFEKRYRVIELMDKGMGIAETMRFIKRGRDFVRTWRRRAPEVRNMAMCILGERDALGDMKNSMMSERN